MMRRDSGLARKDYLEDENNRVSSGPKSKPRYTDDENEMIMRIGGIQSYARSFPAGSGGKSPPCVVNSVVFSRKKGFQTQTITR